MNPRNYLERNVYVKQNAVFQRTIPFEELPSKTPCWLAPRVSQSYNFKTVTCFWVMKKRDDFPSKCAFFFMLSSCFKKDFSLTYSLQVVQ